MSDPFYALNINNLQTFSATNNTRLQTMNQTITKPLMSSQSPQLPQQQMRSMTTNVMTETADEELDERKKFEKHRKFQIQQKRLQEMSFSKSISTNSNSSADKLMANLIQKVESEAKLDKRINNSHKSGLHVYNQPIVQSSATNPVLFQSSNSSQYRSHSSVPQMYLSGQQIQQNNSYFNSFYPINQMQKTVVQQMTNTGHQSISYSPNVSNFDANNRTENYNNLSQMTTNQTISSINSSNIIRLNQNSDPIFSISTINGIQTGVNYSNRESVPSVVSTPVVQKLPICFEDLSKIPALYTKVWNYVKTNDISNVCDTNRLYPVLLSVGLPQTVLAKLWSVVNQTIPGQLTRHELNMALALIALIQKNSINPLAEVYKLDSLPIPEIQFFKESEEKKTNFPEVLQITTDLEVKSSEQTFSSNNFEQNLTKNSFSENSVKREQNLSNLSQTLEKSVNENNTEDDFDDFKSAQFETTSDKPSIPDSTLNQNKETIKTIPLSDNNIEEEFDDFKSISFNQTITSSETQNIDKISKPNILSDAFMSNISAISSQTNSHNISLTPVVNQTLNSFKSNSSEGFPAFEESEQIPAFNPNLGSVDKYSVFRELTADTNEDDFGNFLSHNFDAESVDSLQFNHENHSNDNNDTIESISHQIIQTCRQIIHRSFNVLVVSHGEDTVLEAIRSTDGNKFAFDLLEIYSIVKRVETNLKSCNKLNDYLIKLIDDIENTWNSIVSVFSKASINVHLKQENPTERDLKSSKCILCNSGSSVEQPVITFGGFEYHISCANFWLNCINPTLPQPLIIR